jgi:hypothetical protein
MSLKMMSYKTIFLISTQPTMYFLNTLFFRPSFSWISSSSFLTIQRRSSVLLTGATSEWKLTKTVSSFTNHFKGPTLWRHVLGTSHHSFSFTHIYSHLILMPSYPCFISCAFTPGGSHSCFISRFMPNYCPILSKWYSIRQGFSVKLKGLWLI